MNLVIQAHTLKNEPLTQPITGRFDERGGTIGRSDTNTLSLPDPERHISRLHAEVWFSNGAYSIRNVGSANAILLNGRSIAPGEGAAVTEGDELVIGAYALRVAFNVPSQIRPADRAAVDGRTVIKASAGEWKTNPPQARVVPRPAAPAPLPADASDPFADIFDAAPPPAPGSAPAASSSDPFADLFGSPSPSPSPSPARAPAPAPGFTASPAPPAQRPPESPAPARLPDDFDPFADLAPPKPASAGLGDFMAGSPAATPQAPAPGAGNAFSDLLGGGGSGAPAPASSLDDLFGLAPTPAAQRDPLADFMASAPPAPGQPSTDPLAMFGGAPAPSPARPADFNHTPELKGAYRPPAVQRGPSTVPGVKPLSAAPSVDPVPAPQRPRQPLREPPPAPAPSPRPYSSPKGAAPPRRPPVPLEPAETTMPAMRVTRPLPGDDGDPEISAPMPLMPTPAPRAPAPTHARMPAQPAPVPAPSAVDAPLPHAANTDALWAAFCAGAGINFAPPQGLNPALMRVIGEVLRHSVDGTLKLVAVRAAAKQELRAQVTTIQSRNNNPLKFSPDAGAAIEQLLQPPMRGFMVGPQAVNDVMDDLLGHAIGTMAGMRSALEGVLSRFEPSQLESKLGSSGVMDTLLPMNRRAKLWELYLQHFKRIQGDAEEDFHELFGKAFIRAYEDQLDRLDNARHPDV